MVKRKRIYLDYNATSPLAKSVIDDLVNGDAPFGNPSSQHTSGKEAKKGITKAEKFLFDTFQLNPKHFNLIFHSGATEAFNTFFNLKPEDKLVYFVSDHPAVKAVASSLQEKGIETFELGIEKDGGINFSVVEEKLKNLQTATQSSGGNVWLNYTYVHNETGVVWPVEDAVKLKKSTGCKLHIDAVQSVGKLEKFNSLPDGLDVITFSGHKFGALKGIGFSFFNKELSFKPFVYGGGQQGNLRSGTVNSHGIFSVESALRELIDNFVPEKTLELKNTITKVLNDSGKFVLVANDSLNTICCMHKKLKADILMVHFDLSNLDVSSGSACSSGSLSDSPTLLAMGFDELAANNIRISFGPNSHKDTDIILTAIEKVLKKV